MKVLVQDASHLLEPEGISWLQTSQELHNTNLNLVEELDDVELKAKAISYPQSFNSKKTSTSSSETAFYFQKVEKTQPEAKKRKLKYCERSV